MLRLGNYDSGKPASADLDNILSGHRQLQAGIRNLLAVQLDTATIDGASSLAVGLGQARLGPGLGQQHAAVRQGVSDLSHLIRDLVLLEALDEVLLGNLTGAGAVKAGNDLPSQSFFGRHGVQGLVLQSLLERLK